jgi:hypothetical protein
MDNKDIQYWEKVSVWTLRFIMAIGLLVVYLVVSGHIDKLIS